MPKSRNQIKTNLQVLARTKQRPQAGDVFVFRPKGLEYFFGLVVNANIRLVDYFGRPMRGRDWDGILVYAYNQHAPIKCDIPRLDLRKLLLPPLILDVWCWWEGYVERVGQVALSTIEILSQHCFMLPALVPGRQDEYLDEHGRRLERRVEPCGGYGLTPFRGFDDKVSRALGIPPASDL